MKKQIDLQLIAIFAGGLLFNYLFWMEQLAINLLLFSIFIMAILYLNKEITWTKKILLICFSHLFAAFLVVYNQSILTVISYYISLVMFIGFVHAQQLRSTFTALLSGFVQILCAPFNLIQRLIQIKIGNFSIKPVLKPIKYLIIPIFVIIIFTIVYSIANPVFAAYLDNFTTGITTVLTKIFTFFFADLSFARFMHIIIGILFTAGLVLAFKDNILEREELSLNEKLIRNRNRKMYAGFSFDIKEIFAGNLMKRKMALKTENIIGIISFVALNLLLLFLNSIDIATLWATIGNTETIIGINYSAELHEGTNALILSVFMAMLVILYFFSGNLNFFSKNKTIRILAYIWIIQNAFLVASVFLRDFRYIDMHGLTYKRIGVLIFLMLCTVGLITVYIKVAKQKTLFYLCKVNGWVWYMLLLFFGLVNWDVFIVNYNIQNRNSITLDLDHLLDMSDKTLPLLDENRTILQSYLSKSNRYDEIITAIDTTAVKTSLADSIQLEAKTKQQQLQRFNNELGRRINDFNRKWKDATWLSWNYRDWQTNKYIKNRLKTDKR